MGSCCSKNSENNEFLSSQSSQKEQVDYHEQPAQPLPVGSMRKPDPKTASKESLDCIIDDTEETIKQRIKKVKEKMRTHPAFEHLADNEESMDYNARQLVTVDNLRTHFSSLDKAVSDVLQEILVDAEYSMSPRSEAYRGNARYKKVTAFQVKLVLTLIDEERLPPMAATWCNLLNIYYGPTHAVLIVNDVKLEWNTGSLVIPDNYDPDEVDCIKIFQTNVTQEARFCDEAQCIHPEISDAIQQRDFTRQVEKVLEVTELRHQSLTRLLQVIIKYNTEYSYNVLTRNCQDFVKDAMKALGIEKPPILGDRLNQYLEEVRQGKTCGIPKDFKDHVELDQYITLLLNTDDIKSLSQGDAEYLQCMYFQFHLVKVRHLSSKEAETWKCDEPDCKLPEVEKYIDENASVLRQLDRKWM